MEQEEEETDTARAWGAVPVEGVMSGNSKAEKSVRGK